MSEWQPIETAPMDGTPIIVFSTYRMSKPPVVVVWKENPTSGDVQFDPYWADAATNEGTALYFNDVYFTHWMPLPPPPASEEQSS